MLWDLDCMIREILRVDVYFICTEVHGAIGKFGEREGDGGVQNELNSR
jgi:hypothetical protein